MTLPLAILAGGLASRMKPLTERLPKSLLPVAGRPFIDHQLRLLAANEINEVVICAGHMGDMIQSHVQDGRRFGLRVSYSFDGRRLLGTGGALKKALPLLGDRFMTMYGDSYLLADYAAVAEAFINSGKNGLMTVFHNKGRFDASNVHFENGRILSHDKQAPTPEMQHIEYGLGCLNSSVLRSWKEEAFDLSGVFSSLAEQSDLEGLEMDIRFYEIGSMPGLAELEALLLNRAGNPAPDRDIFNKR